MNNGVNVNKCTKYIYVLSCIVVGIGYSGRISSIPSGKTSGKTDSTLAPSARCADAKKPLKNNEWLEKMEDGCGECTLSDNDIACIVKRCTGGVSEVPTKCLSTNSDKKCAKIKTSDQSKADHGKAVTVAQDELADSASSGSPKALGDAHHDIKKTSDKKSTDFSLSSSAHNKEAQKDVPEGSLAKNREDHIKKDSHVTSSGDHEHDGHKESLSHKGDAHDKDQQVEKSEKAPADQKDKKSKALKDSEWKEPCDDSPVLMKCSEKTTSKSESCGTWKESCGTDCPEPLCQDTCMQESFWKETCSGKIVTTKACGPLMVCESPRQKVCQKACVKSHSAKCPKKCSLCPQYCAKSCTKPCTKGSVKSCKKVIVPPAIPCSLECKQNDGRGCVPEAVCARRCVSQGLKKSLESGQWIESVDGVVYDDSLYLCDEKQPEKKSDDMSSQGGEGADKKEEKKEDTKKGPPLRKGQWQEKWKKDCPDSDLLSYIPCETALVPSKWYLRLNGGVPPSFWIERGMMQRVFQTPQPLLGEGFFQDVVQMPQFRDLYRLPGFMIAGSLGWAADENVELFGEVAYCRNKGIEWSFTFPYYLDNQPGIFQGMLDSTPYRSLAGYVGARYHWGMYFKNTLSFYTGLKMGLLHRRMVISDLFYTLPDAAIAGFPGKRQPILRPNAITFPRNTYTSIGLQIGFDVALPDLLGVHGRLTLGGRLEAVATAGVYPRSNVLEFKDSDRAELPSRGFFFGYLGTQFTFPASLVLSLEFDIDDIIGGFKYFPKSDVPR